MGTKKDTVEIRCETCGGSGHCTTCGGSGCPTCSDSGDCSWCGGSGVYEMEVKEEVRVWTKTEVKGLLVRNDEAVRKGIVAIYRLQTEEEKVAGETRVDNGVGFNGMDAPFLSSLARQVLQGRNLSEKQLAAGRKALLKYAGQLTRIANGKV